MSTSAVIDFINLNRDHFVEELKAYLAIPSISALPEHASDVRRCAEWTQHDLLRQPKFEGLRDDKPAKAVVREKPKKVRRMKRRSA